MSEKGNWLLISLLPGGRGEDSSVIITLPECSAFSDIPEEALAKVFTYLTLIPRCVLVSFSPSLLSFCSAPKKAQRLYSEHSWSSLLHSVKCPTDALYVQTSEIRNVQGLFLYVYMYMYVYFEWIITCVWGCKASINDMIWLIHLLLSWYTLHFYTIASYFLQNEATRSKIYHHFRPTTGYMGLYQNCTCQDSSEFHISFFISIICI